MPGFALFTITTSAESKQVIGSTPPKSSHCVTLHHQLNTNDRQGISYHTFGGDKNYAHEIDYTIQDQINSKVQKSYFIIT